MLIKQGTLTKDIQKVLNENREIEFESGKKYDITTTLYVKNNTTINLNGASLRRFCNKPILMSYCDKNTTKYNGAHDIIIKNGIIEGMNKRGFSASNLVALFHAKNIRFENVTFLDAVGSHCCDVVGCQNVKFEQSKFLGYCSCGKDFRESVQIDFCYYDGLPYFDRNSRCYDMTHCDGVTVNHCTFGASSSYPAQFIAIGTHTTANSILYHTNITITNNVANGNGCSPNSYGYFFRIQNMKNVIVSNNIVSNYGRFVTTVMPIELYNANGTTIKSINNKNKVHIMDTVLIKDNTVKSRAYNRNWIAYAVWIEDTFGVSKNITVDKINGVPNNAICIKGVSNFSIHI